VLALFLVCSKVDYHVTGARVVAVFPQVDALPGAQHELPVLKGNADLGRSQCRLDVGRHIICPLQGMGIERVSFGYQTIQPVFQIYASAIVVIFLNQQAGGSMAYKQGTQTLVLVAAAQQRLYLRCYRVQSLAVYGYGNLFNQSLALLLLVSLEHAHAPVGSAYPTLSPVPLKADVEWPFTCSTPAATAGLLHTKINQWGKPAARRRRRVDDMARAGILGAGI
jgi:hypothetical protein